MRVKYRFALLGALLVIALLVSGDVVVAQDVNVSPEVLAAVQSFDQKYLLTDYIAYSGIDWVARHAVAIHFAEDFDAKYWIAGSIYQPVAPVYVAQSDANLVGAEALVVPNLEDFDNKLLMPGSIVHPMGPPTLAVDVEGEIDMANVLCWDRRYFLHGHVVCPEPPVAVDPDAAGS